MTRLRAAGTVLAAVGVVLLGIGVERLVDDGGAGGSAAPALAAALHGARPARPPFAGLTQTRIRVGVSTLRVVIADDPTERNEGLRRRRDLGAYDGMLFVFGARDDEAFTMSTVPIALEIAFYDGHGRVVSRLRMTPCAGTDAECPAYTAGRPYRFALETLAGRLPRGDLAPG